MSTEKHINSFFGDAYRMLRNMRTAFNYMNKDMMQKILTAMIRLKLKYVVVWSPHKKKHKNKLERIQRMATKLFLKLKELQYEERQREMQLMTLEERSVRGDMIAIDRLTSQVDKMDNENLLLTRGKANK